MYMQHSARHSYVFKFMSKKSADLVMNADTEAAIDVVCVKEPPCVDQQQVKVVYCRGLHHPVHPTRLVLNEHEIEGKDHQRR